jgi:hypothetical protein
MSWRSLLQGISSAVGALGRVADHMRQSGLGDLTSKQDSASTREFVAAPNLS